MNKEKINFSKYGFTLIELLAVITVLSIIMLIAVPIVSSITKNSKENANKKSIELYGRAIDNAVSAYYVKYPYKEEVTLEELEVEKLIDYKGSKVDCDVTRIIDREVFLSNCKVGKEQIEYEYGKNIGNLINDADNDGEISIGDKYTYRVNKQDTFNFYVLSLNEDESINLIMDRNICEDGTYNYNEENNYCRYAWHLGVNNNTYGPDTAMEKLYDATKNWSYVPNMIMNYYDEKNKGDVTMGYQKITTNENLETSIERKDGTYSIIIGNSLFPLKARLPNDKELKDINCSSTFETCPNWIVDNIKNSNHDNYFSSETIENIKGYWALCSAPTNDTHARFINYFKSYDGYQVSEGSRFGIRPVITVTKYELSK